MYASKFIIKNEAFTEDGTLFNSDFLNNLGVNEAIKKIIHQTRAFETYLPIHYDLKLLHV